MTTNPKPIDDGEFKAQTFKELVTTLDGMDVPDDHMIVVTPEVLAKIDQNIQKYTNEHVKSDAYFITHRPHSDSMQSVVNDAGAVQDWATQSAEADQHYLEQLKIAVRVKEVLSQHKGEIIVIQGDEKIVSEFADHKIEDAVDACLKPTNVKIGSQKPLSPSK